MIVDCKSFSETIDRVSTISDDKLRTAKFQIGCIKMLARSKLQVHRDRLKM